jgi:hypothetical protein
VNLTIDGVAPDVRLKRQSGRGGRTGRDHAVRGKVSPIRIETIRLAYHLVRWMEWMIESYDRRTDWDGHNRFTSETAFINAAEELLRNIRKGSVSAKLPMAGSPMRQRCGRQWRTLRSIVEAIGLQLGQTIRHMLARRRGGLTGHRQRSNGGCRLRLGLIN